MIAALAIASAASARVVAREWVVSRTEADLDRQSAALAVSRAPPSPATTPVSLDAAPRALLADALLRARAAQAASDAGTRSALLGRAALALAAAAPSRPYWGELWATTAFVRAMRNGADADETLAAFGRSYDDAPYLTQAGPWRIGFGFAHWRELGEQTRSRTIDEAVWLARLKPQDRDTIFALARASEAYRRFLARWIATRRDDPDFGASVAVGVARRDSEPTSP